MTRFVLSVARRGPGLACRTETCCYAFNGFGSGQIAGLSARPLLHVGGTTGVTMRRYSHRTETLRSISGFSLMEVMITTAIIGILSAIAVPNYVQWHARYQLKQAAMEVTSGLATSRFMAMNRNIPLTTTFAIVGGQLTTTSSDSSGNQVFTQTTNMPRVTSVVLVGGGNIQFSSSGLRASGTPGVDQLIQLTNVNGTTYSVRLTQGGKARWCSQATCP